MSDYADLGSLYTWMKNNVTDEGTSQVAPESTVSAPEPSGSQAGLGDRTTPTKSGPITDVAGLTRYMNDQVFGED